MSTKSIVAVLLIGAAVVGIPLALKARPPSIQPEDAKCVADHTCVDPATAKQASATTAKGLPRFMDIGTTNCAPCKVMLGVMAELEQQYPDALRVEFVDTAQQTDAMDRFGVRAIPTQLFFSPRARSYFAMSA